MKNAKYYKGNSFEFFKKVCSSKRDIDLRSRMRLIEPEVEKLYTSYDKKFDDDNLVSLSANGYKDTNHSDLKSLYAYHTKRFVDLRTELTTTDNKRSVQCQNCTINEVDTFDHFVPQEEFPEFSVHPRNLICCCTSCNRRRNSIWRLNGKMTSLNLYLDKLPEVEYLFVSLRIDKKSINTNFFIDNRNKIEESLFQRIESHYTRLNLFYRFSESADSVASSFKSEIEKDVELSNGRPISLTFYRNYINKERAALGFNYWQSILKLNLLSSNEFLSLHCKLESGQIAP